jgi:3-deoxy-D-manno-octulosonic-acid transferase
MGWLFNLVYLGAILLGLPWLVYQRVRHGKYREGWAAKFFGAVSVRSGDRPCLWLHAVSVGEVNIALKLARALRALEPALHCVLTTTTTTGFALARKSAPPWIEVMYTPLDYWPIMCRAFSVIRPGRIILVEAEVWPNLAAEAHARRVPLALANARLSPRSERRYRRFRFFVAPTFRLLDLVCVPEQEDADRWAVLGVPPDRIHVTGSIKYDPEVQGERQAVAAFLRDALPVRAPDSLILFGGSTHRGEEEILASVFLRLREQFPSLRLFIAPRHVERLREIRAELTSLPLRVALASERVADHEFNDTDCLLLDTTGELERWYPIATVVFVGKSLTAHGGQNPVEPILAGKPVVFGPHMENFAALAKSLVAQKGAIQIQFADSLERAVAALLRDSEARQRLVQNAHEVLSAHQGATARAAKLIADFQVR